MFAIISGVLPCDFMINSTMNAIAIRTPTPCVTELKISSPIVYLLLVCCIGSSFFMFVKMFVMRLIQMAKVCELGYN